MVLEYELLTPRPRYDYTLRQMRPDPKGFKVAVHTMEDLDDGGGEEGEIAAFRVVPRPIHGGRQVPDWTPSSSVCLVLGPCYKQKQRNLDSITRVYVAYVLTSLRRLGLVS